MIIPHQRQLRRGGVALYLLDALATRYHARHGRMLETPRQRPLRHLYGGRARVVVVQLTANQAMILSSPEDAEVVARSGRAPNGTWGFVLQPINEESTRLIVCSRDGDGQGLFGRLFRWFIFDPAHFIMERKMLLGIKRRAEASATDGRVG